MSTHDTSPDQPQRTTATVRDRDVATQIVIDLTDRGIARERVTTRDLDPDQGVASARDTGDADMAFSESTGKRLGAGFLIAFLIGAVVGTIGVSLLFEPPWANPLAAGITLAVAIGVGYIAGGIGFLQSGISGASRGDAEARSRIGEERGTTRPTADRTAAEGRGLTGATVEVIVEAASAEEARTAEAVFAEHRVDRA